MLSFTPNITWKCLADTLDYLWDLNSREPKPYAIMMYDAVGKGGSNILNGNIDQLGSYSECLSAEAPSGNFQGEYCKLQVEQEGTKFAIGICVPNSCSSQEITTLSNMDIFEFKNISFLAPLPSFFTFNETSLLVADTVCSHGLFSMDAFASVCLCLSTLFILLPVIGSIYVGILQLGATSSFTICKSRKQQTTSVQDQPAIKSHLPLTEDDSTKRGKNYLDHILRSFCLQENIPAVFTTKLQNQEYPALDGIRVLSLLWIVSGHTSQLTSVFNIDNSYEWKARVLEQPLYLYSLGGPVYLGVDSFFLMSGFLSARSFLNITESSGKKITLAAVMKYICRRIKRLQPLHLSSICMSIGFISLVPWGSFWELPKHQWDNCRRVWWANLLLITNFVSVSESCSGWTWYLSNDFQFHLVTPLLMFLYVKAKRVMFAAVTVLVLASSITTTLLSFFLHLPIRYPTGESHSRLNYWVEYYTKPYCRCGPFLVGLVLAILMSRKQSPYLKNKAHAAIGWICSLLTMLLIVTMSFVLDDSTHSYSIAAAIYQGLHRTLWACALGWIIISCHEGYGGVINDLLSCHILGFLSKISYACYLIHPIIIIMYCGLQETLIHYLDINMFYLFIGHSVLTIAAGLALTVLVEQPFQQLLHI
ncbi:O-acyltransferase like protein-like [Discoglossus pictus]